MITNHKGFTLKEAERFSEEWEQACYPLLRLQNQRDVRRKRIRESKAKRLKRFRRSKVKADG